MENAFQVNSLKATVYHGGRILLLLPTQEENLDDTRKDWNAFTLEIWELIIDKLLMFEHMQMLGSVVML
ncbi:predicted protein [Histoplasma mississippiense (nom. inval.)]|uniref:predicted protein n=1 Tax=Ajellomyces capsulatus (strain NAm1 / WU24) TaxID=2059318 RepID=UPI000157C93C|nr:predicted protein [Histoplasma mississippiense (nom. inval.)]EDN09451.1 predicted protein [Histoplasma mississippiense (nom. inval.)]